MQYYEFLRKRRKRIALFYVVALGILFGSILLALSSGNGNIDFSILNALFEAKENIILYEIRFPRVLGALFGGALLGVSGCVMQGVLRNPLASPYTLGIAQAAAFGASFAIIVLGVLEHRNPTFQNIGVVGCAFTASMVCMVGIMWFGKLTLMKPSALILAGVALGALFHALTMMLQFFASDLNAAAALFWTFGDLSKATWENTTLLAIIFFISFIFLWINHWKIDALGFGDEGAKSRGVSVGFFRIFMLFIATLTSAIVVAYFGIIGFIGLIAAHLVRLSIGESYAILIPFSSIFGSILLLLADIVSKLIIPPIIIPIGIVTAFMGVPLFLYLLTRKRVQ